MPTVNRRPVVLVALLALTLAVLGSYAVGTVFAGHFLHVGMDENHQETGPNDLPDQPTIELDPMLPLSEVGEVTIEIIREQVFPDPRTTAAGRRAGGGPPLGNYVYLHGAHRYVSLPDDVKLIDKIGLGTCILPPSECPKLPLYTFQRGEAKVALDTMGVMWDAGEGTDFSAFPFFVFEDADGQ
jgi:hypothetical protein